MLDLGTYDYVQKVYNENMNLSAYKLPKSLADGEQVVFDDALLRLTMTLLNQRVLKITIRAFAPKSLEYMRVFEGFEFGFDAVSTWIQNYHESVSTHGRSSGVVKGILADYDTNPDGVLKVSLTRVSDFKN